MKVPVNRFLLCCAGLFGASPLVVAGHVPDSLYRTFETIQRQNPWFTSSNAAALVTASDIRLSEFDAAYQTVSGDFYNLYEGSRQREADLSWTSLQQIGSFTLTGELAYKRRSIQGRGGSSLIDPSFSPVSLSGSEGAPHRIETYGVKGAFGYALEKGWSIGGDFSFNASSMARKLDMRNQNTKTELVCAPALFYRSERTALGLTYAFLKTDERIEWISFGDQQIHEVYLFEGMWFGDKFSYSSLHPKGRDYQQLGHRAGVQGALQFGKHSFYGEFFAGRKSLNILLLSEEERGGEQSDANYDFHGRWSRETLRTATYVDLTFGHHFRKNYTNLQRKEQIDNLQQFVQYGRLLRNTAASLNGTLTGRFLRKRNESITRWGVTGDLFWGTTENRFRVYPRIYRQEILSFGGSVKGERNLLFSHGMIDASLRAGVSSGGGVSFEAENPDLTAPSYPQRTDLLEQEYAYLTASRLSLNPVLRYTHFLKPEKGISLFVTCDYTYVTALDGALNADFRNELAVTLSILF